MPGVELLSSLPHPPRGGGGGRGGKNCMRRREVDHTEPSSRKKRRRRKERGKPAGRIEYCWSIGVFSSLTILLAISASCHTIGQSSALLPGTTPSGSYWVPKCLGATVLASNVNLIIFIYPNHKTYKAEVSFSRSYWQAWLCRCPNGKQQCCGSGSVS
jgi:hypothetical protein